jgi:hypothetical protein
MDGPPGKSTGATVAILYSNGRKEKGEWGERSVVQRLGHEVALVIDEAAPAMKFNGGIAVIDLQMEIVSVVLTGSAFGEVEKLRADSLPSVIFATKSSSLHSLPLSACNATDTPTPLRDWAVAEGLPYVPRPNRIKCQ